MQGRVLGRVAALAALVVVAAVAALTLLGGSDPYRVQVRLINASQLVKGNLVTVAGEEVGKVEEIELTDDSQAEVSLSIHEDWAPLRQGTRAVIRQRSLSGVANRHVALQLGGADRAEIADGGTIPAVNTQASVDLDQLFATFDEPTREGVQRSIRFFRDLNRGREGQADRALELLPPSLMASSRLFAELNRNEDDFEDFIVETSGLVTDLASRDDELAGLVSGLNTTLGALAAERDALTEGVGALPGFLRRANTTFVNLRASLDDLDPVVEASRPLVRGELREALSVLRPFARDAEPTIRDLSRTIRRPGEGNDLVELLRAQPAVARIATQSAQRNGEERPGAFAAIQAASKRATPQLGFLRPYAPDLMGWFDDFSHSGAYDALGSFSRAGLAFNGFTFSPTLDALVPVPLGLRDELAAGVLQVGRNNRCPGSVERKAPDGSNPYLPSNVRCDPSQVPVGR